MHRHAASLATAFALLLTAGCKSAGDTVKSAGSTLASGAQGLASSAGSLINVNLSNVLNDLAVDLKIDKANIPINAQIPITIAANVCGVSINILSVSTGGQANCTATTSSPELAQVVQQQMAAGGNVGGGAQGGSTSTTGSTTATTGTTTTTTQDPKTPQ
ncbi:MAG TPA: hypothetical protein VM265_05365 [Sphingomicrobium sp.]|nr:hypothetical protein [Sphingomicrobium sp.]